MSRLMIALCTAFGMFSILPVPKHKWDDDATGLLIPLFPVVGAAVGGLWAACAYGLFVWQPPALLHAVLLCLVPCVFTGFLHMDGYLDAADAVLSRRALAERQRILKDSHIGSFAAIALAVYFLLAVSAAHALAQSPDEGQSNLFAALVCIPVLSRCGCGLLVLNAPLMSETGYAAMYRESAKPMHTVWLCALGVCCLVAGWWLGGAQTLAALLAGLACGGLTAWGLCRNLGGVNGDVSGCVLTIGELSALLCFAIL